VTVKAMVCDVVSGMVGDWGMTVGVKVGDVVVMAGVVVVQVRGTRGWGQRGERWW